MMSYLAGAIGLVIKHQPSTDEPECIDETDHLGTVDNDRHKLRVQILEDVMPYPVAAIPDQREKWLKSTRGREHLRMIQNPIVLPNDWFYFTHHGRFRQPFGPIPVQHQQSFQEMDCRVSRERNDKTSVAASSKQNITPLQYGLDEVLKLRPVSYT